MPDHFGREVSADGEMEQIATTLNMSMRKVFRLHDETLKKIVIPESWQ